MRSHWVTAVLFLASWVGCGAPTPPAISKPRNPETAKTIPGAGGVPGKTLDALDLAVGPGDTLHVVWRESGHPVTGGLPHRRTLYARGERGGASWTQPEELAAASGEVPRILRGHDTVHLLAGRRLVHLRRDDGGSWQSSGQVLPQGSLAAEGLIPGFAYFGIAVDAVPTTRGLTVATLARHRNNGPLFLEVVSGWPTSPVGQRLAQWPDAAPQQPAPSLVIAGRSTHLLWAVGEELRQTVRRGSGTVEIYSTRARLFYRRSDDDGTSWHPAKELTESLDSRPEAITDVKLIVEADGLFALFASRGLFLSRSKNGRDWSPPVRIAGYREASGSTATGTWSVTTSADAIAWIDERFQSTDRRWWKPLGGWPWSDSPDGITNDVFFLPLRDLRGDPRESLQPRRLTPPDSHAFLTRLGASPTGLHLVWSGRQLATPTVDADSAPFEIFHLVVPID